MSGATVKFAVFFGGLGLLLSLIFSLLSGNGWMHNLLVVFGCTAISAVLGAVVCSVLQAKVPEFFETFGGLSAPSAALPTEGYSEEEPGIPFQQQAREAFDLPEHEPVAAAASSIPSSPERKPPGRQFGDHIIVDKVKIKNEPRLMAQAIRTMLTKDD